MRFRDRTDAGQRLAQTLSRLRGTDVVVLGLPRGGVPVAYEVARALDAPLDVIVVRKLGVPFQPELAMGAIGEQGVRVMTDDIIRRGELTDAEIAEVERRERADLATQARRFRAGRERADLAGRTAVIVDDGVATGSTARAACQVARLLGAARVILAVPVGAPESLAALADVCDEVVCLYAPDFFMAVGTWYEDFRHVSDAEVASLLDHAAALAPVAAAAPGTTGAGPAPGRPQVTSDNPPFSPVTQSAGGTVVRRARNEHVAMPAGGVTLAGRLVIPADAPGIVLFVHGSGSSRHSPRNRFVATQLNEAGLGTLLFDLLTADEELDRANVFDIDTLALRLTDVTRWLRSQPGVPGTGLGYFGASTGAAAALWAAAEPDAMVDAIVSRGGRPDLAEPRLGAVRSPTLLIVGGRDEIVLDLNRRAQELLRCENRLSIVPGATHLFEEPGALKTVTRLARSWFAGHFPPGEDRR
ncbi:MAG: phosphoribosyltransferase family protein [Streptosporangiaceae bacterium]